MKRRRWFLITVTVLFGLVLFAWFVYLQFPYGELARYLAADLKGNASLDVRIERVEPSLVPMTFYLSHVELALLQSGAPCSLVTLPRMSLNVGTPGLLFGSVRTHYRTKAYEGTVEGRAEVDGNRRLQFSSSIEGLDLSLWKPDQACNLLRMTGILGGEISYTGNLDHPIEGSGKAEMTLVSGTIEGLKRFLISFDKITVDRIRARAELQKGRMRVEEFRLEAKELSATVSGEVVPAPRVANSRLNLRIEGTIDPEVREQYRIPFDRLNLILKGTPSRPQVRFLK